MKYLLLPLLFVAIGFTSCKKYPEDRSSLEEQDIIVTQYDRTTTWASYATYAINDTVLILKNKSGKVRTDTGYTQFNDQILNNVNSNMTSLGFVRVAKDQNPQVAVDVTLIEDENIDSYTYWYGSSWYWGYPSYGYYYPWSSTRYYKYEVGTISVSFLDLTNIDTVSKRIPLLWSSQAIGTVSSTPSYNASRIDRAINVMFEQSTYLKK